MNESIQKTKDNLKKY